MIDEWRALLTVAGLMAAGVGFALSVGMWRIRHMLPHPGVSIGYASLTALTASVASYWRLRDGVSDLPANVGDFTAVVPTVGALIVGLAGWRVLGGLVGHHEVRKELEP